MLLIPDCIRVTSQGTLTTLRLLVSHHINFSMKWHVPPGKTQARGSPSGGRAAQSRALPFHVYGTLQARQPLDVQLIARLVEKMLVHSQTCAYLHFELAHAWIVSSMDESPKLCLEFPGTHPLYSKDEKVTQMSAIHQTPFPHKFSRIKQKLLRASAQRGPGSLLPSCM